MGRNPGEQKSLARRHCNSPSRLLRVPEFYAAGLEEPIPLSLLLATAEAQREPTIAPGIRARPRAAKKDCLRLPMAGRGMGEGRGEERELRLESGHTHTREREREDDGVIP